VTSVGENKEKANTIQPPLPPFLCFSHLQRLVKTLGRSRMKIQHASEEFIDGEIMFIGPKIYDVVNPQVHGLPM